MVVRGVPTQPVARDADVFLDYRLAAAHGLEPGDLGELLRVAAPLRQPPPAAGGVVEAAPVVSDAGIGQDGGGGGQVDTWGVEVRGLRYYQAERRAKLPQKERLSLERLAVGLGTAQLSTSPVDRHTSIDVAARCRHSIIGSYRQATGNMLINSLCAMLVVKST